MGGEDKMADNRITVLDNEFATVWFYPEPGIVYHVFHQYSYDAAFREILIKGAETVERYHCTKWLSDDRRFGAVHPDDKEWADKEWQPRVLKAGWRFWAMVLPERVAGQLNLQRLVKEYQRLGLVTRIFNDPEDAMKWLLEQ